MKKFSAIVLGIMLFSFLGSSVYAQGNSQVSPSRAPDEPVANEEVIAAETETPEENTENANKREERLINYQARVEQRLSDAQARRIASTCKAAQVKLKVLDENSKQVQKIRNSAYSSIVQKLENLREKLAQAGVTSAEFDAAVDSFAEQSTAYALAFESYVITLEDLSTMLCEDDPQAFNAALTVVRQERAALLASSQALRQYVNDTIKPVLQQLRGSLEANDGSAVQGEPVVEPADSTAPEDEIITEPLEQ
jgi:uncharacterized protein YukE